MSVFTEKQERRSATLAEMLSALANNPQLGIKPNNLTREESVAFFDAAMEASPGRFAKQQAPFDPSKDMKTTEQILQEAELQELQELNFEQADELQEKKKDYKQENDSNLFWDIIYTPLNIVTSSLITAGAFAQDFRNLSFGENFNRDNLAEAWDWNDENHIDFGTAALYGISQTIGATPLGMIPGIGMDLVDKNSDNRLRSVAKDWGFGFANRDYDIFDPKDRAYQAGDQGLNIGTVLTQLTNLAGELVIDPLNLIPFGKLGKSMKWARKLREKDNYAKAIDDMVELGDIDNLTTVKNAIGKGENRLALQLSELTDDAGRRATLEKPMNFSATTIQETVFMGSAGLEQARTAQIMSDLAGRTSTKEEAVSVMSNVLMATELGSVRAVDNLVRKFGDDAVLMKNLDDLNDGGFLNRIKYDEAIFDPADFADSGPDMVRKANEYQRMMDNYVNQVAEQDGAIASLLDLTTNKTTNAAGQEVLEYAGAGSLREYNAGGRLSRHLEMQRAKFRAYKVGDLDPVAGAEQYSVPLAGGKFFHILTNPARTSQGRVGLKNEIDITDETGSLNKVASWIQNSDKALGGKLNKSGKAKNYIERFRLARSIDERKVILKEIEVEVMEELATQRGMLSGLEPASGENTVKALYQKLTQTRQRYQYSMASRGYALAENGDIIMKTRSGGVDADLPEKTMLLFDIEQLGKAITEDQIFWRGALGNVRDATITVGRFVQRNWASLVLLRLPRITRELMQGGPPAIGSGLLYEGWKNGSMRRALKSTLQGVKVRGQGLADSVSVATDRTIGDKELQTSLDNLDSMAKNLQSDINNLEANILGVLDKPYKDLTPAERKLLDDFASADEAIEGIHITQGELAKKLDEERFISSYENSQSARIHADNQGTFVNIKSLEDLTVFRAANKNRQIVQRRTNGKWETLTVDQVRELYGRKNLRGLTKSQFRILPSGKNKQITRATLKGYGKKINFSEYKQLKESGLADVLGIKSAKELSKYVKNRRWKDDESKIIQWAESNNVAAFDIADSKAVGNRSLLMVPSRVDYGVNAGKAKVKAAAARKQRISENPEASGIEIATNRGSRREALERISREADAVRAQAKTQQLGYEDTADDLMAQIEELKVTRNRVLDTARRYRNISRQRQLKKAERKTVDSPSAYPEKQVLDLPDKDGNIVQKEIDTIFAGSEGRVRPNITTQGTGAEARGGALYSDLTPSKWAKQELRPSDPRYFEGQAGIINEQYINKDGTLDPLAKKKAEGQSVSQIVEWLTTSSEGKLYFKNRTANVENAIDPEDFVEHNYNQLNNLFFDADLEQRFLSGEIIDEKYLIDKYGDRLDLPTIQGALSDKAQIQGLSRKIGALIGNAQELLSDVPTRNVLGKPILFEAHKREMLQRLTTFLNKNGRLPSDAQQAAMNKRAVASAMRETRKYVYNAGERSNGVEFLRWFAPFINAQVFTAKALAASAFNDPKKVGWMLYQFNKVFINGQQWIDSDGNPTGDIDQASALVFQIPESFRDTFSGIPMVGDILKQGAEIRFSKNTLDPIFAGNYVKVGGNEDMVVPNPFAAGFGPFVALPTSEFLKGDPDNKFWNWVAGTEGSGGFSPRALPFGASNEPGSADLLIPGAGVKYLIERGFDRGSYLTLMAKVSAYENGKFSTGEREDPPSPNEIRELTNSLYDLKFGTNFLSLIPFSTQIKTESDLARELYNRYREAFGTEDGENRFLIEHPDLVYATIRTTENKYSVDYTPDIVKQLEDNKDLVESISSVGDEGADMVSWLLDTEENYEFNQAAYAHMRSNGYITTMSPEDIARETRAKYGWSVWRKGMDVLDGAAVERGTTIEENKDLSSRKTELVQKIKANPQYGSAWFESYGQFNPSRREKYVEALDIAFNNDKWMSENGNKPEVKAIASFLDLRQNIKNRLLAKQYTGQPHTLASNPEVKEFYLRSIGALKQSDIRFAEFYNRYFEGDTII